MKRMFLVVASVGALVLGSAGPSFAHDEPHAYTCTGGDFSTGTFVHVPSGHYSQLTIAGACDVEPGADIHVVGNVTVRQGAVFDAQSAPSTITVGHNVRAGKGALLGLGCQPDYYDSDGNYVNSGHPCVVDAEGSSVITIRGNVTAGRANTVLLNGITVKGNVTLAGGGGDIPWSVKNNTIGRNLKVHNVTADWFGALFNKVHGNVILTKITATDPEDVTPTVFVVRNVIRRNLVCSGIGPALSGGFFPGEVNTVGGHARGQCAALV
jgi:hypothetical protein